MNILKQCFCKNMNNCLCYASMLTLKQMFSNWKSYLIHNNREIPFCVYVSPEEKEVVVYAKDCELCGLHVRHIESFKPKKIFVGKSPKNSMTEYSGAFGPDFDGNTFLLDMGNNTYVHIGSFIYSFTAQNEIIEFVSPVGNNKLPYPYAIDTENNYYFLLEFAMLKIDVKPDDPYNYYYDIIRKIGESENIDYLEICNEKYEIITHPEPRKWYNDLTIRIGNPKWIKKKGSENIYAITKNEYIKLLTAYNEKIGLKPLLDMEVIFYYYGRRPPGLL